jgi:low affinity Fe/Cu permease
VFLIQNSQNRDATAIQVKLNGLHPIWMTRS